MTAAGLQLIVQKESVVATHMGEFVPDAAAATSARYLTETQTFVTTPVTLEYQTTVMSVNYCKNGRRELPLLNAKHQEWRPRHESKNSTKSEVATRATRDVEPGLCPG
jgi:hypothetical protein